MLLIETNGSSAKVHARQGCDPKQHSFTKGKLCLTGPVVLYGGVMAMVNKGRLTNVIYLNFLVAEYLCTQIKCVSDFTTFKNKIH